MLSVLILTTSLIHPGVTEVPPVPKHLVARIEVSSGKDAWASPLGHPIRPLLEDSEDLEMLRLGLMAASGIDLDVIAETLLGGPLIFETYRTRPTNQRLRDIPTPWDTHFLIRTWNSDQRLVSDALEATLRILSSSGRHVERDSYRGTPYAIVDNEVLVAHVGNRLVAGTHEEIVAEAIDRLLDQVRQPPLTTGEAHSLSFDVDLHSLRGSGGGLSSLQRRSGPLIDLTFHALVPFLDGRMTGTITWADDTVSLNANVTADVGDIPQAYLPRKGEGEPFWVPRSPETLAVLYAPRDLADWWRNRETLLPEGQQGRLAKFDQTMTTMFSGQSVAEDVFSQMSYDLAVVIDRQTYDEQVHLPDVRLPGFCVVTKVNDARTFGPTLQIAFQTLLSFLNTERAKTGEAPFLVETVMQEGTQVRLASLVPEASATGMAEGSIDFNYTPAMAVRDGWLLLGTSAEQGRRLVTAINQGQGAPIKGHLSLDLDADRATQAFRDNRDALIAQSILEKGTDVQTATEEVDGFLSLLDMITKASVTLELEEDVMRLTTHLDVKRAP